MNFIIHPYTKNLNFKIKSVESLKFKKTYYEISYFYIEGFIDNQEDLNLLEYLIKNTNYNAKGTSKIVDFTNVKFNDFEPIFSSNNKYAFITEEKILQKENIFNKKVNALNFLIKLNIKKFINSKHNEYDNFPLMEKISLDNEVSNVSIETMLSESSKVGYLKLKGKYPYKGYLEANYISNMLDVLIEVDNISHLIIDTCEFELESDWDNDLPDLEPTHIKYYKTKEVDVYYLSTKEQDFMTEHDNIYFDLDEITSSILI